MSITPEERSRRNKISDAKKGKKFSERHRMRLRKSHKGQIIPDWQREILSRVHKGKKLSIEHRMKIVESNNNRNKKGIEVCRFLIQYLGVENTCIIWEIARKEGRYDFYIPTFQNTLKALLIPETDKNKSLFMLAFDYVSPSLLLSLCILSPSKKWDLPQSSPWERIFNEN